MSTRTYMLRTLICPCCQNKIEIHLKPQLKGKYTKAKPKLTPSMIKTLEPIEDFVIDYFHSTKEVFHAKSRKREVVFMRHCFFYIAHLFTPITYSHIGLYCGGNDHTTVIHGVKSIGNLLETKNEAVKDIEELLRLWREREQATVAPVKHLKTA